jgi:DNA-binding response OmpR family regulator
MDNHSSLGTILLVDDHLPLLRNMAFLLEIAGFDVISATDGVEALNILEDQTPDLVISDVKMPRVDGYGLLKAIRNDVRWHNLPFIFASAQYQLKDLVYGLDLGANDYVPKPFDIYDVLDSIQRTVPSLINEQRRLAG